MMTSHRIWLSPEGHALVHVEVQLGWPVRDQDEETLPSVHPYLMENSEKCVIVQWWKQESNACRIPWNLPWVTFRPHGIVEALETVT